MGHDRPMDRWKVAQAVEFVRVLRAQLGGMTSKLALVERQNAITRSNARACALRIEATTLRRDIRKAQSLVDHLERRYLAGDAAGSIPPTAGRRQPSRVGS